MGPPQHHKQHPRHTYAFNHSFILSVAVRGAEWDAVTAGAPNFCYS